MAITMLKSDVGGAGSSLSLFLFKILDFCPLPAIRLFEQQAGDQYWWRQLKMSHNLIEDYCFRQASVTYTVRFADAILTYTALVMWRVNDKSP